MSKRMPSMAASAILWPVPGPVGSCGYLQGMPLGTGSPTPIPITVIDGYRVTRWEKHATQNAASSRGPGRSGSWYGHDDTGSRIIVR